MNKHKSVLSIRWFYLAVGVIAMLFAGVLYAWSILKAPLATEFGWGASELALNFTLAMSFFCMGGLLGAAISKRLGSRVALIIAGILAALGFLLTVLLQNSSVVMLYLSYGVLAGLGIGIAYNVLIATVSAWFPDKKGLCSGCLMMGFGASALILGNVENFDHKAYTSAQMLCRPSFWMAFLCISCLAAVGSSVISFAKDLALSVNASETLAVSLVGVLSVCNGFGRILTGALFDAIGRRKTMLCANVLTIGAAGVTLLAISVGSLPLCIAGLCLTGMSYGACPTITAAFTSSFFGMKYFSTNMALMTFTVMAGSFIATASNKILEITGGYTATFIMLLGLTFVAFILNVFIQKP